MSDTPLQLNCLIIDDEPLAHQVLIAHISKIPSLNIVGQCSNAIEAFEAIHKYQVDLLFLDINMPVVSGLNFLRSLKEPPAVILTTAYNEYALDGYELDVVDYLLKPISFERFLKAVKKAAAQLKANGKSVAVVQEELSSQPAVAETKKQVPEKNYFFVKAEGKLVKVNHADIHYIEGMKDYLKIYTGQQTIVCHHTLKAMEELLPADKFIRVHKSYVVALSAIKSIDNNIIYLSTTKSEIPLGSSFREAVLAAIA